MLENKDYCDYETCVALKEIGFNEKCHGYYEPLKKCFNTTSVKKCWCNSEVDDIGVIICPTLYEAQKWLREEKFLLIVVDRLLHGEYVFSIVDILNYSEEKNGTANSYEEALSEGIKEAVKILKEKEDETI